MIETRLKTAAFSGHRTYNGEAAERLLSTVNTLYAKGFTDFLCGMAVGFDLAAAEAVLACRGALPDVRLVAVIPFRGQESRFSAADRERFHRIVEAADKVVYLAPTYYAGCYAQRNNYLIDNASVLVAWYDGSQGGTRYTVQRALKQGLEFCNLYHSGSEVQRLF